MSINRNQWMIIALIIVLIINTIAHLSHPAYKFYRESAAANDKKYDDFVSRVEKEFAPAIISAVSNISISAGASTSAPVAPVSASAVLGQSPADGVGGGFDGAISYFVFQGRAYIRYGNNNLTVGDVLWGDIITRITPSTVFCRRSTFLIPPEKPVAPVPDVITNTIYYVPYTGRDLDNFSLGVVIGNGDGDDINKFDGGRYRENRGEMYK